MCDRQVSYATCNLIICSGPLRKYENEKLLLNLPDGVEFSGITYIAVGNRPDQVCFTCIAALSL